MAATQATLSPVPSGPVEEAPSSTGQPTSLPLGHGKAWSSFEKMGVPVTRFINKLGVETFWPTSLEEESEKAGRILRAFCQEGIAPPPSEPTQVEVKEKTSNEPTHNESSPLLPYSETNRPPLPPRPTAALLRIPPQVINGAQGLAIFSLLRGGAMGASYSAGSGVLIARNAATNEWSSPSGIIVNSLGLGFMAGIDVYDCVLVINTCEALEEFISNGVRVSIGADLGVSAGPWGAGRGIDFSVGKKGENGKWIGPGIYSYVKSKGVYAGISLDGTVIAARNDENSRFYGERIDVREIVGGQVRRWTGLGEVLGEIEKFGSGDIERSEKRERKERKEQKPKQAPVLLEFIDRRGQRRGSDGVWYDVGEESEKVIEYEPSVKGSIHDRKEDSYRDEDKEKKEKEKPAEGKA